MLMMTMNLLSANHQRLSNKSLLSIPFTKTLQPNSNKPSVVPSLLSFNLNPVSASLSSSSTTTTTTTTTTKPQHQYWPEFSERVSGEWDGFCAEFTADGSPIELPENVVPEAFREWEVQVYDWQTQCPTLAQQEYFTLTYKLIKLLPTVGCEADAATRYSVDERVAGGSSGNSCVTGLIGYDAASGSYVGVWDDDVASATIIGGKRVVKEVEHCLVDPSRDEKMRVRVVMVVEEKTETETGALVLALAGVRVFSEWWEGPWRNGEQMGGCAVKEAGFALTARLEVGDVVGVWEQKRINVATFQPAPKVR